MTDRIEADYVIETPLDPERAAAVMAGEQSTGTFISLPGETRDLLARSAARIEAFEVFGQSDAPSLPCKIQASDKGYRRAHVTLSWPVENIGPDLPNLVATVAGNLFELREFSGLRLEDIRLPNSFRSAGPGPRFGARGTRDITGVREGPIIGTIIKPSVGLSPEDTADLTRILAVAGIDFVKDDELQANGPSCPFDQRVRAVMRVLRDHEDATGKKVMFAFNLTGEVDDMKHRHDLVLQEGGSCIMISLNSVGPSGFLSVSRHSELPIHAHRNGWGAMSRSPMLGWSYPAWSKLWRLAGADHMHVNGLGNKFSEPDESVIASAKSLQSPLFADEPCTAMPVFSSGQTIRQPSETYRRLGNADCIYAAGGGIIGHPDGPGAGVQSLRESWEAAMAGISVEDYAKARPSLARALEAY